MDKRIYGSSRELLTTLVCLTESDFICFGRRIYGSVFMFISVWIMYGIAQMD